MPADLDDLDLRLTDEAAVQMLRGLERLGVLHHGTWQRHAADALHDRAVLADALRAERAKVARLEAERDEALIDGWMEARRLRDRIEALAADLLDEARIGAESYGQTIRPQVKARCSRRLRALLTGEETDHAPE